MTDSTNPALAQLTSRIVSAFVSNNSVPASTLPTLVNDVHTSLERLTNAPKEQEKKAEPPQPAVSVKKSLTNDYIICLENGKKFKSLRRHLATLGMTPDQYRTKWGLPASYPMVAPSYSDARSSLAKSTGLGSMRKKPAEIAPEPTPAFVPEPEATKVAKKPRKKAA